jgi:signal transduction histidine kinase
VIICVQDTGIGIRAEHHERVFGAFEQVDSSYTRAAAGNWLGLALTKRMVELHGAASGCAAKSAKAALSASACR